MAVFSWRFSTGPLASAAETVMLHHYLELRLPGEGRYVWNEKREDYDWAPETADEEA